MTYIGPLEQKALIVAYKAHLGQSRKYTGEPYIVHPIAVAGLLRKHGITNVDVLAAALLHDVLEDTELGHQDVIDATNREIATLVWELTDTSTPEDGNRETRKAADRKRLSFASPEAQSIKLADLIDNTKSIVAHDPGFAKIYLREKEALLKVLTKGCHGLYLEAKESLEEAKIIINNEE